MADEQDSNGKKKEFQIINPPQTLSAKVEVGGPGAVDMAVLERAEQVIADLATEYLDWVQEDLENIQEAMGKLKTDGDQAETHLERIFSISHDIKGQGGSFGYDLMTIVGDDLCRFVEKMTEPDTAMLDVIQVHIDTMKLIIKNNMKGDGGGEGVRLLKGLDMVAAKVTPA